jgi:hypothetical protein
LLLQSITCWCTNIEPESRWARGVTFWLDSEARVQIAPSGMMEKAEGRFQHFFHSSSVCLSGCLALVIVCLARLFFRVMSSIVSFVSSGKNPSGIGFLR